jgi:GNAT superfamily N-acetyltransferase
MLLRKGTPADAPALAQAWFAMMTEGGYLSPAAPEGWAEALAAAFVEEMGAGRSAWFVVEADGRLAATAAVFFRSSFWNEIFAEPAQGLIAGVYTWPEFRRRGHARQLVEAAIAWAKDKGVKTLRLRAAPNARGLYESLGFAASDEMVLQL